MKLYHRRFQGIPIVSLWELLMGELWSRPVLVIWRGEGDSPWSLIQFVLSPWTGSLGRQHERTQTQIMEKDKEELCRKQQVTAQPQNVSFITQSHTKCECVSSKEELLIFKAFFMPAISFYKCQMKLQVFSLYSPTLNSTRSKQSRLWMLMHGDKLLIRGWIRWIIEITRMHPVLH